MASTRALEIVGDIVSLARNAPSPDAFDRELLALLDRTVGFDIAFVVQREPSRARLTLSGLGSERTLAGLPDPVFASMLRQRRAEYDRELAPVMRAALARRGVAVDSEVLPASVLREAAFHRELKAPVGGRHALLATATLGGRESLVMLGRTGSAFRSSATALVEHVLPAISLAHASFAGRAAAPERVPVAAPRRARDARDTRAVRGPLTAREREVLSYLCLGYTNRDIAAACGSSPNTVKNQLASVFAKIGATTRAEAVGIALRGAGP